MIIETNISSATSLRLPQRSGSTLERLVAARFAQKIDQRLQGWPDVAAAWIVEEEPVDRRRRPIVENGCKTPRGNLGRNVDERHLHEAHAIERRLDQHLRLIDDQPALDVDLEGPALH